MGAGKAMLCGIAVVLIGIWLAAAPAKATGPSPEAGAELAARWCAACHVVSSSGAGTNQAPDFLTIAHHLGTAEIRSTLSRPHGQAMKGFGLKAREIDDVAAYISSLADDRGPAPSSASPRP